MGINGHIILCEDYVSFEVAKLLKEKGFDEKCRYIWIFDKANDPQDTDGISKVCAEQLIDGSFMDNSDIKKAAEYGDWFKDYHKAYLCPTLQMAMKWLREVHNIFIQVDYIWSSKKLYTYTFDIHDMKNARLIFSTPYGESFNTYEEAVEEALKYCLTNLI